MGSSKTFSLRDSINRARSLSVKIPTNLFVGSVNITAPLRRPDFDVEAIASRIDISWLAIRQESRSRIIWSTLANFFPRDPPGWKRAKSRAVNCLICATNNAIASPTAIITAVLLLGAKPCGQASLCRPIGTTKSATPANGLSSLAVIAIRPDDSALRCDEIRVSSSLRPELEMAQMTSAGPTRPKSP